MSNTYCGQIHTKVTKACISMVSSFLISIMVCQCSRPNLHCHWNESKMCSQLTEGQPVALAANQQNAVQPVLGETLLLYCVNTSSVGVDTTVCLFKQLIVLLISSILIGEVGTWGTWHFLSTFSLGLPLPQLVFHPVERLGGYFWILIDCWYQWWLAFDLLCWSMFESSPSSLALLMA